MRSSFSTLVLFLAALVVPILAQSPSGVPSCTFECPPEDLAGRPLILWNTDNAQLFCRYQTVPNDFFCKYFLVCPIFLSFSAILWMTLPPPPKDTGLQKQDHDDGECPLVAIPICTPRKRTARAALPRSPRAVSNAAREAKPEVMKTRGQLGAKKREG